MQDLYAACKNFSCGMWDLLVVVLGYVSSMWDLSCSMWDLCVACGIFTVSYEIFIIVVYGIFVAACGIVNCSMWDL